MTAGSPSDCVPLLKFFGPVKAFRRRPGEGCRTPALDVGDWVRRDGAASTGTKLWCRNDGECHRY